LSGNFSHALTDARSHPSFADAARFLDCPVLEFKHRNPEDLARCVRRCGPGARLIVLTDGMFAQDGSTAPLDQYLKLLPRDAVIVVDDAHGAGVLGKNGRGTLEELQVSRRRIIQTITLSKAFGAYGGAILGPRSLRQKIFQRSHLFIASTPLPLPLANAAIRALDLVRKHRELRQRLLSNAAYVKKAIRQAGFDLAPTPGPILPVKPADRREAARMKRTFLKAGIYPPFIKYPGGPAGGFFRFVISSEHTPQQMRKLLQVLLNLGKTGAQFTAIDNHRTGEVS
jgi:7-keto-8-aminopelargonate synthetase-like enzyme